MQLAERGILLVVMLGHPAQDVVQDNRLGDMRPFVEHDAFGTLAHGGVNGDFGPFSRGQMDRAFGPGWGHDKRVSSAVIDAAGLRELVSTLIGRGYRVVGPTLSDNAIVLAELTSADDLPRGWGVDVAPGQYRLRRRDDDALFGHSAGPQSWKQFLHPPRQLVWSSDQTQPEEPPRYAFIGVRACDLAAIKILNGVLGVGAHPDQGFVGRLRRIFVVAVNCTEPGGL